MQHHHHPHMTMFDLFNSFGQIKSYTPGIEDKEEEYYNHVVKVPAAMTVGSSF